MDFRIDRVPNKITPCPIKEAIFELRFEADVPYDVIPGLIFSKFQDEYPNIAPLPIFKLPESVRNSDPNIRFAPYHAMSNDSFSIQFGPRSMVIISKPEYPGWTTFAEKIFSGIEGVNKLGLIKKPLRAGLRYITFFENLNVLEKLNAKISLTDNAILEEKTILRTEFDQDGFLCILHISNNAETDAGSGSLVDIDIIKDDIKDVDSLNKIAGDAHNAEKNIFFSLLDKDYLNTLNPDYES